MGEVCDYLENGNGVLDVVIEQNDRCILWMELTRIGTEKVRDLMRQVVNLYRCV